MLILKPLLEEWFLLKAPLEGSWRANARLRGDRTRVNLV